jgi:hypothetical protein
MLSLTVHILGDVTVFQCVGRITFAYADGLRIAAIKQPRVRVLLQSDIVPPKPCGTCKLPHEQLKTNR